MKDAEARLYDVLEKTGFLRLSQKLLRTHAIWRASGLSYATAVIATTGAYVTTTEYATVMLNRMAALGFDFSRSPNVLDFGTGLGGNLLSIAHEIRQGWGLDVNPFYITQARRIAARLGIRNLSFLSYDGIEIPHVPPIDVVIGIGPFERVAKPRAKSYVSQLAEAVKSGGSLILYFLPEKVKQVGFGRLLGQESYVFWTERELSCLFEDCALTPVKRMDRFPAWGSTVILSRQS